MMMMKRHQVEAETRKTPERLVGVGGNDLQGTMELNPMENLEIQRIQEKRESPIQRIQRVVHHQFKDEFL